MIIGLRTTLLMAIAAVVVSGGLAWLKAATEITPRGALVVALHPPFPHEDGMAWQADQMRPFDRKALLPYSDDPAAERGRSPVIIYEEGKPLGPAHSNFADISKLGRGRFTFWTGQGLIFSTSDGSDPNSNGRRYWAVVP
jgi:hypothetical protein